MEPAGVDGAADRALTLVIGGARSGKSGHAEGLARATGLHKIYVATATAWDDEMRERIAAHRRDRAQAHWQTVEEPLDLVGILARETSPARVALVDCLTLWLTNVMLGGHDVEAACRDLVDALPRLGGPTIFVANEVGWGIVPENALARRFRDAQGRLNQMMAVACGKVVLVVAGLPLVMKPSAGS